MVFIEFVPRLKDTTGASNSKQKVPTILFVGTDFAHVFEDTSGCKQYCGVALKQSRTLTEEEVRKINPPYLDLAIRNVQKGMPSFRLTYE